MSDWSQGPGWWQASDGKWYPPEQHPDKPLPMSVPPPHALPYAAPYSYAPSYPVYSNANAPAGPPLAPYGLRVIAFLIDWFIVSAVVTVIGLPLHIFHVVHSTDFVSNGAVSHGTSVNVGPTGVLIDAIVAVAFGTVFIGAMERTPGMAVVKVRVVDVSGGGKVGYGRAFARSGFEYLLAVLFFIPWVIDVLFPLWDPLNQALHDKVARTVVVKVQQVVPIHEPRNLADLQPDQ